MTKRPSFGTKEPGRKTTKVSFSAGNDVVDRLQEIARNEDATVSRIIDRFIRAGMAVEDSEALQQRLSERLERAIERIEARPLVRLGVPYDVFAEQALLAAIMAGVRGSKAVLQMLDEHAFFVFQHASAWKRLRAGDVAPGERCAAGLYPFLISHGEEVGVTPLQEYLARLQKAGPHLDRLLDRALYRVTDAYLHRASLIETLGEAEDRLIDSLYQEQLLMKWLDEGSKRLADIGETRGFSLTLFPHDDLVERMVEVLKERRPDPAPGDE